VNVVDSSAWLAYFTDEPGADHFAAAIEDTAFLAVPAICIHEVFRFILREQGEDAALQAASLMQRGTVLDLDASLAMESAKMGLDHGLALADSIIYACTLRVEGLLWTQDAHFAGKAHVRYFPKRQSKP
jgi:toxin FitB